MSNLVIVAIPDENDRVWKVSSEKIPHLTLLFLGDVDKVANADQIVQFVEHAANTTLKRFYLPVDRRGTLGEDDADVLFFKKGRYDYKAIRDFRASLLQDNNIKKAYDGTTQFEGPWTPHLTLGYPTEPAKTEKEDWGQFYSVDFNRIAVWTGDFDGPEFLLKDYWDEFEALESVPMDVAMSGIVRHGNDPEVERRELAAAFLAHHGVKGMRWGVIKEQLSAVGNAAKSAGGSVGKAANAVGKGLLDANFENRVRDPESHEMVQTAIINKANTAFKRTDLPAIKNKSEYQKAKKLPNRLRHPLDPVTKVYRKEVKDAYISRLEDAANSMTNASGNRQYTIRERGWELPKEGGALPKSKHYWDVTSREIKHAAGDITMAVEVILDDDGFVTDIKDPIKDSMAQTMALGADFLIANGLGDGFAQTMELGADFLEHYGVKGMHWGTRREAPSAVGATATSRVPHGTKRKTKIDTAGGENHPAHEDAIKVAEARIKLKKSGVAALSNSELQTVAKRLQLETQVGQLTSSRGQKFIVRQLEQTGQQTVQRNLTVGTAKKVAKKAGRAAATGAVTVALL